MVKFKRVQVTNLKVVSARVLKALDEPMVVTYHGKPIAAIVPYAQFIGATPPTSPER